jgi:YggT family protein
VVPARKAPRLLTSQIDLVARIIALSAFAGALVVVATHWAVRRRFLNPFAWWPNLVRRLSDPMLRPVEKRLLAAGGNPEDGPLWLTGAVVVGGLLLISGVRWLLGSVHLLVGMRGAGPGSWLHLLVSGSTSLVMAAILARVIGSWLGMGRYSTWMKPAYFLSDWIVEPIRRRLPPFGPLDFGPIVAYLILLVLQGMLPAMMR